MALQQYFTLDHTLAYMPWSRDLTERVIYGRSIQTGKVIKQWVTHNGNWSRKVCDCGNTNARPVCSQNLALRGCWLGRALVLPQSPTSRDQFLHNITPWRIYHDHVTWWKGVFTAVPTKQTKLPSNGKLMKVQTTMPNNTTKNMCWRDQIYADYMFLAEVVAMGRCGII